MRKVAWLTAVGLLAVVLSAPQVVWAADANEVISANFLGEDIFWRTDFANFELSWVYAPDAPAVGDTFAADAVRKAVPWGIGLNHGTGALFDEKFAIVTGLGGVPSVVVHEGVALLDITGADAAAFADFIGAGPGFTNLEVFGVGQISQVGGVDSAVVKDFSTVANPGGDIATQMTFILRGMPMASLVAGPFIGSLLNTFSPGGLIDFYEDKDLDFDPREVAAGGAGIPLTTAEFVQATGAYHDGVANNEHEKDANAPDDPEQALYLSYTYSPIPGSDEFSLQAQWNLSIGIGGVGGSGHSVVIGGVTYFLEGSDQFVVTGEPFKLVTLGGVNVGVGGGLFAPGERWNLSGQAIFGRNPATNPAFEHQSSPFTHTFVTGAGIGANPQLTGGPVIPEPMTGTLFGLGLAGAAAIRRRRLV